MIWSQVAIRLFDLRLRFCVPREELDIIYKQVLKEKIDPSTFKKMAKIDFFEIRNHRQVRRIIDESPAKKHLIVMTDLNK